MQHVNCAVDRHARRHQPLDQPVAVGQRGGMEARQAARPGFQRQRRGALLRAVGGGGSRCSAAVWCCWASISLLQEAASQAGVAIQQRVKQPKLATRLLAGPRLHHAALSLQPCGTAAM